MRVGKCCSALLSAVLLIAPAVAVWYHMFHPLGGVVASARTPLLNDSLLHLVVVQRVAAVAADLSQWNPVRVFDHVLGGHGLGFPLFHHYQQLPHVVVGVAGALLGVSV
jgi:hypothetical protein